LVVAAAAVIAVPSASGIESTIYPGVGIGNVSLGMTLRQVEKALGPPQTTNTRARIRGRGYVEYGWDFSSWRVGFINTRGRLHAALIGYGLRRQRTANGVGVGTSYETLKRKLPVTCFTGQEGYKHPYRDPSFQTSWYCFLRGTDDRATVFTISCTVSNVYYCPRYRVYEVIVRTSF